MMPWAAGTKQGVCHEWDGVKCHEWGQSEVCAITLAQEEDTVLHWDRGTLLLCKFSK